MSLSVLTGENDDALSSPPEEFKGREERDGVEGGHCDVRKRGGRDTKSN